MVHVTDKGKVEQQFSKMPWGNEHRFVYFQNEDMNGKVNVMNVEKYTYVEEGNKR